MRQIAEGPKLYIASLNNALKAARPTSKVASKAHKEIPWVYAATMHETQVAEVWRLSSIKDKLRRAIDDQKDRLASSETAYDEVAKAARQEVLELRADNSRLLKEGDIYRQRRLNEENRQLNQMLQARSGNERQALLKAQLKDGELARKQKALRQARAELEKERIDRQRDRARFEGEIERLRVEVRRAGRRKVSVEMDLDSP